MFLPLSRLLIIAIIQKHRQQKMQIHKMTKEEVKKELLRLAESKRNLEEVARKKVACVNAELAHDIGLLQ